MQSEQIAAASPRKTSRRKLFVIAGLAGALGAGGVVAAQSFSPPGFGPGMMRHGGPMAMDPAAIADMADRGVRHMAIEIDATPEQQEKLRAIVRDLTKDLAQYKGAHQQAAERARALLTQTTVDKAEIEKFRAEQITKMDAASKRVAQAIGDAAEVLTPTQRQKLADRMPRPGMGPGAGGFWRR